MNITTKLKERFCKDCNIPLRLFQEPYFTERLELYDKFYGTLEKWELFQKELAKYSCEQDYFEEYNRIKDAAILQIKNSEAYQRFNEADMNQYRITHMNLPGHDIFKPSNDGRNFISIDMKKANFSSLRHYDASIFQNADTWEAFISRFTNNQHIMNSKYVRQVILGNCNPKRHVTYEKYLMDKVLTYLTEEYIPIDKIVFFSNDEIVFHVSEFSETEQESIRAKIDAGKEHMPVPVRSEWFTLHKIMGTDGYYKEIYKENGEKRIAFKGMNSYILPIVLRRFLGEEVSEHDRVFYFEGLLAQLMEVPDIQLPDLR